MTPIVSKPWGSFQVIEKGEKYTVKKIRVKAKGKLSLQSHMHRSEHWIVVEGEAQVTRGDEKFILKKNQSSYNKSYFIFEFIFFKKNKKKYNT